MVDGIANVCSALMINGETSIFGIELEALHCTYESAVNVLSERPLRLEYAAKPSTSRGDTQYCSSCVQMELPVGYPEQAVRCWLTNVKGACLRLSPIAYGCQSLNNEFVFNRCWRQEESRAAVPPARRGRVAAWGDGARGPMCAPCLAAALCHC